MENNEHTCDFHGDDMPTITLTLEDDTEIECNVLGTFDVGDNNYIALEAVDSEEIIIFRFALDDEGNMSLSEIECDDEFEDAEDAFYRLFVEE